MRLLLAVALLSTPALAAPDRADHGSRDHHADRDDSYWGRQVDAWRDHRYGDPTVRKLRLYKDRDPSNTPRHSFDDDDEYEDGDPD